jgi:CheY-like chemotaxis protein
MKTLTSSTPYILLIDDNRDGLLVRRSLLEEVGCRVKIAINGEEGLKLFEAEKFDVVVTDYRMPRMNGAEVIVRIRKLDPNARVILLSGFVDPLGLTEQNTGADAVIAKSSNEPAHLVRSVKRLVNRAVRKPPASQKGPSSRGHAIGR